MRGRVAVLLLLSLLLFAPAAVSQCNFTRSFSAQFRSSLLDLAVDGNDLWAATSYGVSLFDRATDPPTLVHSLALPGITRTVAVNGATVYAGSGTAIYAIRKDARSLRVAGSVETGGNVNDLEATTNYLYAATAAGLQQYDLLDPVAPQRTNAVLATSQANVLALTLSQSASGTMLYSADGDNTVEAFTLSIPTIPQRVASIETLPRTTAVHATTTRLYTSDGQSTDLFFVSGASATKVTTIPGGSTAFATLSGDIAFTAGSDRRFTAVDLTNAGAPVYLFASEIVPNGGTINRVSAMQVSGSRLYVAAGDAGLLTWDISHFASPFPLRSYGGSGVSSVMWAGAKLYASRAGGGISELTRSSGANLTSGREWDTRLQTLHDGADGVLITSSGSTLFYWTLTSTIPTLITSAQLRARIASAILLGTTAYVVLDDHSVWALDLTQTTPDPRVLTITASSIGRTAPGGASAEKTFATALVRDDGTTLVQFVATEPPPGTTSPAVTVPGATTTRIALSGTTAAVFTWRGINLVDLRTGTTSVVPGSSGVIARGLAFSGNRLLELTADALLVWDVPSQKLLRTFTLPREGTDLAVGAAAAIATPAGVTAVAFDSTSAPPSYLGSPITNAYYRKSVAAADRLYLFDGRSVDIFATTVGVAPRFVASVQPPGAVDLAADEAGLYAVGQLVGSTSVMRYTRDGILLTQRPLDEDPTVTPLSVSTAEGAVWVSYARTCSSGTCESTAIVDRETLARTALLDGAAVDVAVIGSRAYAIFDLPAEVRAYDLRDPLHPALLAARATEGAQTPVSIAVDSSTVYVLGEKLVTYTREGLDKSAEQFDRFQPVPAEGLAYVDQQVFAAGGCVVVTGRTPFPLMSATSGGGTALPLPAPVRSLAASGGKLYLLTDDSLEVLTQPSQPVPPAARRRVTN